MRKTTKEPVRKSYQAPVLVEVGSFRKNTGLLGVRNRESLVDYPRNIW